MNVMKVAHSDTRDYMAQQAIFAAKAGESFVALTYRQVFVAILKSTHAFYKQEAKKMSKELTVDQMFAIQHFEDCIARTLVHFEKLGVNDYYIALCNNAEINDYTLLQHKDLDDVQSPLGWASYASAIVTHPAQADEYVKAFPGVCKLHAQTFLSSVIESFRENIAQINK